MINGKESLDNDEHQVQDSSYFWVSREITSKGTGHVQCSVSCPGCWELGCSFDHSLFS